MVWVLAALMRWPWVPPAVSVVVVAVAGQYGRSWLFTATGSVALAGLGFLAALAYHGHKTRKAALRTGSRA